MNHLSKIAGTIIFAILLILIISALPSLFSYGRPSNIQYYSNSDDPDFVGKKLYKLHFSPDNLWRKPLLYFRQLESGEIFSYKEGKTTRNYVKQASRYFKVSLFYISFSAAISLIAGTFISIMMSDKKRNPCSINSFPL